MEYRHGPGRHLQDIIAELTTELSEVEEMAQEEYESAISSKRVSYCCYNGYAD
jgi:hypothetical protein